MEGKIMFEAAIEATSLVFVPSRIAWILVGTTVGLLVGLFPGLGGMVGMSILLPFVYGMDPISGIGMLVGMMAVTQTSDTFSCVLLGIPGTVGSQATVVDGYPLARQGQAGRALGAAFAASIAGGIIGAVVLLLIIPIARPLVLSFNTPDLFMLTILGLCLVGVLTRGNALKGVLAGLLGMLASTIGMAPASPSLRFTFGELYLMDGVPLAVVALGMFAVPELIALIATRESISRIPISEVGRLREGVRDAWRHKGLVARSGAYGPMLGMIPGVGGSIIDWVVYGITINTSKNKDNFGKGDIRGVIAVESANNSKEGGQLVPTMLFGIPGSGTTAIMLGGLILMGIQPGPAMVEPEGLPILLSIVWSLVIANVFGGLACMSMTGPLSKLTTVNPGKLVPILFVLVVLAAYQSSRHWGDIVAFFAFGAIALVMREFGWPRVPLLIGFVLGQAAERYLYISMGRYGLSWLGQTSVIVITLLSILAVVVAARGKPIEAVDSI